MIAWQTTVQNKKMIIPGCTQVTTPVLTQPGLSGSLIRTSAALAAAGRPVVVEPAAAGIVAAAGIAAVAKMTQTWMMMRSVGSSGSALREKYNHNTKSFLGHLQLV